MHQCEVEDAAEVWRALSGRVDWSFRERGESKETIKQKRVKDQRGKEEVGVSCRAQRTKGKQGGWWSRSKKRREWWMGAVAGEPHSPVERGKAKAENRKKDGCLVLCDPASLGYNAGPPLLVGSGRTLEAAWSYYSLWTMLNDVLDLEKWKITTVFLALIFNFTFKGENVRLAGAFLQNPLK